MQASHRSAANDATDLYLIFNLRGLLFALPVTAVREMLVMPKVSAVAGAPEYVRGVINLRGRVLPLVDLRAFIGLGSALAGAKGFINKITSFEEDHRAWFEDLTAALSEDREFTGHRSLEDCELGRWHTTFRAKRSLYLDEAVTRLDQPHRLLHQMAQEALAAADRKSALSLLAKAKSGPQVKLAEAFENLRQTIRDTTRELVVVLDSGKTGSAVAVDAVDSVDRLTLAAGEEISEMVIGLDKELIKGVARRGDSDKLILILDGAHIIAAAGA